MVEVIDDFNHDLEQIVKKASFQQKEELTTILGFGPKWLETYSKNKNEELLILEAGRKQAAGEIDAAALQQQIQTLENDKTILKTQLLICQSQGDNKDGNVDKIAEEINGLKTKYGDLLTNNGEKKTALDTELNGIRKEVLPKIKVGLKIKQVKQDLDARIGAIEKIVAEIKIEE